MRLMIIVVLFFTQFNLASAQSLQGGEVLLFSYFKNNGEDGLHLAYSEDGYRWIALKNDSSFLTPAAGYDKLMRDPCIIKGPDGLFHMVWTSSWKEKGIGYATTADLIHWSDQKYLQVMKDEAGARNCWAPEIFYDTASKRYIIFWATTIEGKFPETTSKKENGYNHRIYFVTTSDFLSFTKPEILYNQNFNVIDATLIREKNNYVMFLKDETAEPPQKNIRVATSEHLTEGFSKPTEPITGNYWAEGPTVAKLPEGWIVYFDRYREKRMGAVISTDLKTWKDISGKVQFPAGVRHGTVFSVSTDIFEKLR